jgi:hypothetical protein
MESRHFGGFDGLDPKACGGISELMRLTRTELCGLASQVTMALPDQPEGSPDRNNAERSLHNIRRVLAWYDLAPE